MFARDLISGAVGMGRPLARGMQVHVSDASPQGFSGRVTGVYRDVVTITRDKGARELVSLSRRRVTVVTMTDISNPVGENR